MQSLNSSYERPLSTHEKKEQEIYQTMSAMPNRNIELVEQKTKE